MAISRRQVLLVGGLGIAGAGSLSVPLSSIQAKVASRLAANNMPRPYQRMLSIPPVIAPFKRAVGADGQPVHYYQLTQKAGLANMVPGLATPVLAYNGIFPGPTISVNQGTRAVVRFRNQLPSNHPTAGHIMYTSTHLHGSASLPQYDGYADDISHPGFVKDYHFPNHQPARTLWYHDHAVHNTAVNVYSGLAGQYHMHDRLERALLPQGRFDVPLTVSDAMFASNGALGYDDNTQSGLYGDVIMVNGRPWPVMKVQRRVYRFRVLNASLSRSYRFRLSTGDPVTMVATDGGLMPVAQQVASWRHASAERYEILIDFSKYPAGKRIELQNLSNKNNIDYPFTDRVMAFDVVGDPVNTTDPTWNRIPTRLTPNNAVMRLDPRKARITRPFELARNDLTGMWTINNQTWADVVASGYKKVIANPGLGDTEIWEIENKSGGWFHPLHIHLVDFKILSRNGAAPFAYERGPKDVVYVGEGEVVRVLIKFGPHEGRYMIHCHNLPHEDHDMMVQFRVGPDKGDADPNDPMTSAPPWLDQEA